MLTLDRWAPGRRGLGLGVVVLLAALAVLAQRSWPDNAPVLGGGLDPVEQEARVLEQRREEMVRRNRRKARVAQALAAGRLSLLEAAGYYRALDLGPPAIDWERFRGHWPGSNDAERHCHEAIEWAHPSAGLEGDPRGQEVRNRLCAELAEHLRRGPLRLPQPTRPLEDLDHDAD
jgi:hypothetical protein